MSLINKFIDFIEDQNINYLYNDININNINEKILEILNRINNLYLNDEIEDNTKFFNLGLENYKLRILEKIIKNDNIINLDKSLIQNQNDIIFTEKTNIIFPIDISNNKLSLKPFIDNYSNLINNKSSIFSNPYSYNLHKINFINNNNNNIYFKDLIKPLIKIFNKLI
jgi:hypothetical protein